jgi:hypothetical protein
MNRASLSPSIQEVIAVCDRGKCELDIWLMVNGRIEHCSTKNFEHAQGKMTVVEIAHRFFRDVLGELQATNRYIFNLKPNHMMARQFEYQGDQPVLTGRHTLEETSAREEAMRAISAHLLADFALR